MSKCSRCGKDVTESIDLCEICVNQRPSIFVQIIRGFLFSIPIIFVFALFLKTPDTGFQPSELLKKKWKCASNLKQIGIALHHYHDVYDCFPPAYVVNENGKPMHSWRVLILPYLGEQELYDEYDFSEPWDGPNNSRLHDRIPGGSNGWVSWRAEPKFSCPSRDSKLDPRITSYIVIVGKETVFPGTESRGIGDLIDGVSETAFVVEVANSGIHWMEPRDLLFDEIPMKINPESSGNLTKHAEESISSIHLEGAYVLFCDGNVRFLGEEIPEATIRGLLAIDDGEPQDPY